MFVILRNCDGKKETMKNIDSGERLLEKYRVFTLLPGHLVGILSIQSI